MKLYINPENNELHAYAADGSQDDIVPEDFVPATSLRPTDDHYPIITDGKHAGWSLINQNLTLEQLKEDAVIQVEAARDLARNDPAATVVTGSGESIITWQVDPGSMAELNDAITLFTAMGGTPDGFVWRDANNTNHPAPLSLLVQIGAARAVQKQSIWNMSWTLKAQIANAVNVAQLNSIVIPEKLS